MTAQCKFEPATIGNTVHQCEDRFFARLDLCNEIGQQRRAACGVELSDVGSSRKESTLAGQDDRGDLGVALKGVMRLRDSLA